MNLQHVNTFRRWLIGNHPEQSQSVRNMVAEQSATPVWRTSLQCVTTSLKTGRACDRRVAHKGTCGPREAHRVYCPIELDGTVHLCSCPPQSFSRCIVHGISCRWLPRTLRIGPQPSHHEEQVLFWSKVLLLLQLLVLDLGPGRLIICGSWLHTRRISVTATYPWHLSSVGKTPCSRNSGGPRCSSLARQSAIQNMCSFSKSDLHHSSRGLGAGVSAKGPKVKVQSS